MARNIEIKAHIDSVEALAPRAAALATEGPQEIVQDDTFFHCEHGRLKLRAFSADRGELIFYRRADSQGPKESFYLISPTVSPDTLRELLTAAHGPAGRVQKHRTLFLAGRTRIHLDHAASRQQVDEIAAWVTACGHTLLYPHAHPFAGGPDCYAVYCEDPDRIKVEVVAPSQA